MVAMKKMKIFSLFRVSDIICDPSIVFGRYLVPG